MIDAAQIKKAANLARLEVSDDDVSRLTKQLSEILAYAESINELDLTGIKPTAHAVEVENVFREDVVTETQIAKDILKQAPQADGVFFKVPKVL